MQRLNTIAAILLIIGALLHGYGTFAAYAVGTEIFVWSLGSVLAALLTAGIALMSGLRPGDKGLQALAVFGGLGWMLVAIGFGFAIANAGDPRVIWHGLCGLILAVLAVMRLAGKNTVM